MARRPVPHDPIRRIRRAAGLAAVALALSATACGTTPLEVQSGKVKLAGAGSTAAEPATRD